MTGLVVLVVVVSCIVLVAREVTEPRQPATTRPTGTRGTRSSRAPTAGPVREPDPTWPAPTDRPVLLAPPTDLDHLASGAADRAPALDDPGPQVSVGAPPWSTEPRRRPVDRLRWWQRLRSAVILAVMAVTLGALLAAVIGAGALLLLNLLRASLT